MISKIIQNLTFIIIIIIIIIIISSSSSSSSSSFRPDLNAWFVDFLAL